MTREFLRGLGRLTGIERALFLEALWLILTVRLALRLLPFPTVRRYLARHVASASTGIPTREQVVRAVRGVGRRVPGTTCLAEAIVGHAMLQWHGHPAVLRIGVRRAGAGRLDAHAWVECEGTVAIGTVADLSDYAVLS